MTKTLAYTKGLSLKIKIMKNLYFKKGLILIAMVLSTTVLIAQQDPQYTQYIFNQQVINPAYVGSRGTLSIVGLHRSQWVEIPGAPRTQTLGIHSPIGKSGRVGLGVNVVHDEIGITQEDYLTADFSYTIPTSEKGSLALGLKAGVNLLDVDFSALNPAQTGIDPELQNNIDNRLSPNIGLGVFYYTNKFYLGLSVPNLVETNHFDNFNNITQSSVSTILPSERINYYLSSGYTFDLSDKVKFKPAVLSKIVGGSPLQLDLTANFLLFDRLTLGAAYRWSAAFSGLVAFQISEGLLIGFGYDRETTELGNTSFNDGSFEILVRFELFNREKRLISPRFF